MRKAQLLTFMKTGRRVLIFLKGEIIDSFKNIRVFFPTMERYGSEVFPELTALQWHWQCCNFVFQFKSDCPLSPPAKDVWGKVMFLHLSVILFTGGRG